MFYRLCRAFNFGFTAAVFWLVVILARVTTKGSKRTSIGFILVSVLSVALSACSCMWPEMIASIFKLDDGTGAMTSLLASVIWVVALCFVDAQLAINLLRGMKIVSMPTGDGKPLATGRLACLPLGI